MGPEVPEISLDALEVGQDLGMVEHLLTPEEVAHYANFLEDGSPWYRSSAQTQALKVHPMMLANDYSRLLRHHFRTPHLVLVQTDHSYLRPVWTGSRLRTFGRVSDKGLLQGREYVEVETWTLDDEGTEVARMRTVALLSAERKTES